MMAGLGALLVAAMITDRPPQFLLVGLLAFCVAYSLGLRYKHRTRVLEDVKGETVTIGIGSLASDFDEFLPEAQKVLDTVKRRGH